MPRELTVAASRRLGEKLAVAHIHWALPPVAGGVETHLADFSRLLAARGHQVTLFTGRGGLDDGPNVMTVQSSLLDLESYRDRRLDAAEERRLSEDLADELRPVLLERDIGVVHGHNLHTFSPVPALAVRKLEKELDLRVHHTYHSVLDNHADIAQLCREWPGQHAVSRYLSKKCRDELAIETVPTYLGVADDRYRYIEIPSQRSGDQFVLLPARLFPEKRADLAVQMLHRLRAEGLAVRLILTAPSQVVDWDHEAGPFREKLEDEIARLGLTPYVEILSAGFDEMPELYRRANAVIYPSNYPEPLGLAPLEAAASGRPAVVTGIGGLPETVRHGRTGYIVPPNDLEALTNRVRTLLTHPSRARRMGEAGRTFVQRRFTLDRYVDRMVDYYRDIAPSGGARTAQRARPSIDYDQL